jgi:arginine utilization protein RocB
MKRTSDELIAEIEKDFSSNVSRDAKSTILTIKNLIESNSRVEESIDELHKSIVKSNIQNGRLQNRIFYLTVVGIILALIQVLGVIVTLSLH